MSKNGEFQDNPEFRRIWQNPGTKKRRILSQDCLLISEIPRSSRSPKI